MKTLLAVLLFLTATSSFADERKVFPDDYTPHPCAPARMCKTGFTRRELVQQGATMRGFSLRDEWIDAHWDELMAAFQPICDKIGSCFATANNVAIFCTDIVLPDVWAICDEKYAKGTDDYEQCAWFVRIYSLGYDLHDKELEDEAKACRNASPKPAEPRQLDVWMAPEKIDWTTYKGNFTVWAIDKETHVPVQAHVIVGGEWLHARTPKGEAITFYPVPWKLKLTRVPNAQGHQDLTAPVIRVETDGYTPVEFALPYDVRKLNVEMNPPAKKLNRGKNIVTIKARETGTDTPAEMRVMLGDRAIGKTNEPVEIELKRGAKRPEIWITSLYDRYNDVVVAPSEK